MKLSVSLSQDDVETLDAYVRAAGLTSRSAALQRAVRLLGHPGLDQAYAEAWEEWEAEGGAAAWETTASDGVADAAR